MKLQHPYRPAVAAAMILASVIAGSAWAAGSNTATGQFQVSATVPQSCQVDSANNLDFGQYRAGSSSDVSKTTTFQTTCTRGTTYDVALGSGDNAGGAGVGARAMTDASSGDFLGYDLYQDSGYTQKWDGSNIETVTAASSAAKSLTIYGKIPSGQDISAGSYADNVQISINY